MNESHFRYLSDEVVRISNDVLSEKIGIIDGVHQLVCSDLLADSSLQDPDSRFLVGIRSETDHLPIGKARNYWNPDVLKERDAELTAYEAKIRERVFEICRRLIQKYSRKDSN